MGNESTRNIMFRPGAPLVQKIDERAAPGTLSPHQVAKRDLLRYYAVLFDSLPVFTPAEAGLLVEALRESEFDSQAYRHLSSEVAQLIEWRGLAEKWKIDPVALVAKIKALSPGQTMALLDAVARFWLLDKKMDPKEKLAAVGLTKRV